MSLRSGSKDLQSKIKIEDYKKIRENLTNGEKVLLDELYDLDENYIKDNDRVYLLKTNKEINTQVIYYF